MNSLFHFFFFFFLLFTSQIKLLHAIDRPPPARFSGPSTARKQQVFQPQASAPFARDLESDKRRVPTGPNPLHNKKRKA
ncbi:hypothetical protein A4A49_22321 [Nicotiana attenuata]|uniref:Uncharacterized protein n=1 Tax=Nicotiana attenuata TaxID=49451 RepID=A0A1J6I780_NICAT|nr:hypothetical protein A4A49_22321 [Nicotiana attenuata]